MHRLLCVLIVAATLTVAGCQNPTSSSASPSVVAAASGPEPAETFSLSETDTPPSPRLIATPRYPLEMRRKGIMGEAIVKWVVTADGRITALELVRASRPEFGQAALESVAKSRYAPAIKNGRPVNCRIMQPIVFRLNEELR